MKIMFRIHALQRMFQRAISEHDVKHVISFGTVIAHYPTDTPYPSRLLFGKVRNRPLHVVVAENAADGEIIVITVYEPDPRIWESDLKTRRVL